jgi:hypothetical protein
LAQLRGQLMDAEEENKRLQSELAVAEETNERWLQKLNELIAVQDPFASCINN